MTIYRNTPTINKLFMQTLLADDDCIKHNSYVDVFSNPNNVVFDEWPRNSVNINSLAIQQNLRCCYDWPMFDVLPYRSKMVGSKYDEKNNEWSVSDYGTTIIVWNRGKLSYYYMDKQLKLVQTEVLYCHYQKRKLRIYPDPNADSYIITPFSISSMHHSDITEKFLRKKLMQLSFINLFKPCEIAHFVHTQKVLIIHRWKKYIIRR